MVYQIFLPMVLRWRASRAGALLIFLERGSVLLLQFFSVGTLFASILFTAYLVLLSGQLCLKDNRLLRQEPKNVERFIAFNLITKYHLTIKNCDKTFLKIILRLKNC